MKHQTKKASKKKTLEQSAPPRGRDGDCTNGTPSRQEKEDYSSAFYFFWQSRDPFSQWYPSKYELNGVEYSCAEQGMMHGKALLFGDAEVAEQILATNRPAEIKRLGRCVRGFQESVWKQHREAIVHRHSVAKFTQDQVCRDAMLATHGKTLVEASPYDKIWGIGLSERVARRTPVHKWKGLNLLGTILTRVREEVLLLGRGSEAGLDGDDSEE